MKSIGERESMLIFQKKFRNERKSHDNMKCTLFSSFLYWYAGCFQGNKWSCRKMFHIYPGFSNFQIFKVAAWVNVNFSHIHRPYLCPRSNPSKQSYNMLVISYSYHEDELRAFWPKVRCLGEWKMKLTNLILQDQIKDKYDRRETSKQTQLI